MRRRGFTLIEMLVVVSIVTVLAGILIPAVVKARSSALQVKCASNLRQVGAALHAYLIENRKLPARAPGLDQTNPHVLKYRTYPQDVSLVMAQYARSREIFYCPANPETRTPDTWWPYQTGTVAATYQFPFWLKNTMWLIPYPDYMHLSSDRLLACDYLGSDTSPFKPLAYNHSRSSDGSPTGMNELFGDGHAEWIDHSAGWILYGRSGGPLDWYYASH